MIRLVKPLRDTYSYLRLGDLLIDMPMYGEACSLYTMSLQVFIGVFRNSSVMIEIDSYEIVEEKQVLESR